MNCVLIETRAWEDLKSHTARLLDRVSSFSSKELRPASAKWLTAEEVCKALSVTKRALQYYRSCGIIPYTALGNKIFFKEEDIRQLLDKNLIKSE